MTVQTLQAYLNLKAVQIPMEIKSLTPKINVQQLPVNYT